MPLDRNRFKAVFDRAMSGRIPQSPELTEYLDLSEEMDPEFVGQLRQQAVDDRATDIGSLIGKTKDQFGRIIDRRNETFGEAFMDPETTQSIGQGLYRPETAIGDVAATIGSNIPVVKGFVDPYYKTGAEFLAEQPDASFGARALAVSSELPGNIAELLLTGGAANALKATKLGTAAALGATGALQSIRDTGPPVGDETLSRGATAAVGGTLAAVAPAVSGAIEKAVVSRGLTGAPKLAAEALANVGFDVPTNIAQATVGPALSPNATREDVIAAATDPLNYALPLAINVAAPILGRGKGQEAEPPKVGATITENLDAAGNPIPDAPPITSGEPTPPVTPVAPAGTRVKFDEGDGEIREGVLDGKGRISYTFTGLDGSNIANVVPVDKVRLVEEPAAPVAAQAEVTPPPAGWKKGTEAFAEVAPTPVAPAAALPDPSNPAFQDPMVVNGARLIRESGNASVSTLQRGLKVGFAEAGRIMDQLEQAGIVGPYQSGKPREILNPSVPVEAPPVVRGATSLPDELNVLTRQPAAPDQTVPSEPLPVETPDVVEAIGDVIKRPATGPQLENVRVADIKPQPENFQTRQGAYSKVTADKVFEEGFDPQQSAQAPMQFWETPEGEIVPLSGHSRTNGMQRRVAAGLEPPDAEVPGIVHRGITLEEAKRIAASSNKSGQAENFLEAGRAIRMGMEGGADIKAVAKARGVKETLARRQLASLDLPPEVQKLAAEGRLTDEMVGGLADIVATGAPVRPEIIYDVAKRLEDARIAPANAKEFALTAERMMAGRPMEEDMFGDAFQIPADVEAVITGMQTAKKSLADSRRQLKAVSRATSEGGLLAGALSPEATARMKDVQARANDYVKAYEVVEKEMLAGGSARLKVDPSIREKADEIKQRIAEGKPLSAQDIAGEDPQSLGPDLFADEADRSAGGTRGPEGQGAGLGGKRAAKRVGKRVLEEVSPTSITQDVNPTTGKLQTINHGDTVQMPDGVVRQATPEDTPETLAGASKVSPPPDVFQPAKLEEAIPRAVEKAKRGKRKKSEPLLEIPRIRPDASERNAPIWYSKLDEVVRAKMGGAMDADALRAMLTSAGVKPEEMQWSKIGELRGKVTKDQVLEHLAENAVRVEEVQRGGIHPEAEAAVYEGPDGWHFKPKVPYSAKYSGPFTGPFESRGVAVDYASKAFSRGENPTKFDKYTEPGANNYKELLITLPVKNENSYTNMHFEEKNILAHVRMNDRVDAQGRKVLFVEEVQSDWHQKGKKKGYYEPQNAVNRDKQLRDLDILRDKYLREKKSESERVARELGYEDELFRKAESVGTEVKPSRIADTFFVNRKSDGENIGTIFKSPSGNGWVVAIHDPPLRHLSRTMDSYDDAAKQATTKLVNPDEGDVPKEHVDAVNAAVRNLPSRIEYENAQLEALNYRTGNGSVLDAPFKKTWHDLAMKRVMRYAAENGYERVAWTTGNTQAKRYNLRNYIDDIIYKRNSDGNNYWVGARKDGEEVFAKNMDLPEVEDTFGKDVARQISSDEGVDFTEYDEPMRMLSGENLAVGSEGMRGFYDDKLVNDTNKLVKKYGAKVEPFAKLNDDVPQAHAFDVTPAMREEVMKKGLPLFQIPDGEDSARFHETDQKNPKTAAEIRAIFKDLRRIAENAERIHSEVPPEVLAERGAPAMKATLEKAVKEGRTTRKAADLALDFINRFPKLMKDLALGFYDRGPDGKAPIGMYNPDDHLVLLANMFDVDDPAAGVHELSHSLEKFLPPDMRMIVESERQKVIARRIKMLNKEMADYSDMPEAKAHFRDRIASLEKMARRTAKLTDLVDGEDYNLLSASEFFVHDATARSLRGSASRLSSGGALARAVAHAKEFMRAVWQYLKEAVGADEMGKVWRSLAKLDGTEQGPVLRDYFRSPDEVDDFVSYADEDDVDSLLSISPVQTPGLDAARSAGVYRGKKTLREQIDNAIAKFRELREAHFSIRAMFDQYDSLRGIDIQRFHKQTGSWTKALQMTDDGMGVWGSALLTRNMPQMISRMIQDGMLSYDPGTRIWGINDKVKSIKSILEPAAHEGYFEHVFSVLAAKRDMEEQARDPQMRSIFETEVDGKGNRSTVSLRAAQIKRNQVLADGSIVLKNGKTIDQVVDELMDWNRAFLDMVQEDGNLLDPEGRKAFERDFYAPLYKIIDNAAESMGVTEAVRGYGKSSDSLTGQTAGIHKYQGSEYAVNDVAENFFSNIARLTEASVKNRAALDVIDSLATDPSIIERVTAQQIQAVLGQGPKQYATMRDAHIVKVSRLADDGTGKTRKFEEFYQVNDIGTYRAVAAIGADKFRNNPALSWFVKPLGRLKKLQQDAITINPGFGVLNLIRDAMGNWIQNPDAPTTPIEALWDSGFNTVKIAFGEKNIMKRVRAVESAGGGGTGYYGTGSDGLRTGIMDAVKIARGDRGMLMGALDGYKKILEATEQSTRAAAYEAALKRTGDPRAAVIAAMEVTNFSNSGASAAWQVISAVTPFLNARAAGLYKLGRAGYKGLVAPVKDSGLTGLAKSSYARRAAVYAGATVLLTAFNNEYFKDEYDDVEDWEKQVYHVAFYRDANGKVNKVRVPKAFELGAAFGTIPEQTYNYVAGATKGDEGKLARQVASVLTGTFNVPFPIWDTAGLKQIREQYKNRVDFTGRAIVPESKEGVRSSEQYGQNTSQIARKIGEVATNLTEGIGPGTLLEGVRSPQRIEHLLGSIFGPLASDAMGATDLLLGKVGILDEGPAYKGVKDWPFIGNVTGGLLPGQVDEGQTRYATEFYNRLADIEYIASTQREYAKTGNWKKAQEYAAENADTLRLKGLYQNASAQASKLSAAQRRVLNDASLTPAQKRAEIDRLAKSKAEMFRYVGKQKMQSVAP